VKFYDGSIPGIGYSLKGFVSGGTSSLVDYIGNDSSQEVQNTIHSALAKNRQSVPSAYRTVHAPLHFHSSACPQRLDWLDLRNRRVRRDRGNRHWHSWTCFHSVDGFRQNRFPFLGLAQSIPRLRILQSRRGRHHECHEPLVDQLSDKRSNEYGCAATTDHGDARLAHAVLYCGLRSSQNTDYDRQPLLRPHRRSRERDRWDGHSSASPDTVAQLEVTMSIGKTTQPEITRAAERYLEQYGDPLVMNTYLKIAILVLAAVCLALAGLTYKSQIVLAGMHPMIVRINDVGRAEAIDYRNFQYRPQEAENKYYLSRWAELYFSRNRFTIERMSFSTIFDSRHIRHGLSSRRCSRIQRIIVRLSVSAGRPALPMFSARTSRITNWR
jgi:hypothetical protein